MNFPAWVDQPKAKKSRAANRLKYLINMAAAHITGEASVRALAKLVGLNHSTISLYIQRGAFSDTSAAKLAPRIGVPVTHLTNPLGIEPQK